MDRAYMQSPMASLIQFSRRMNKRATGLPGAISRLKRKVAIAVDREAIFSTPVDTGNARSNWIITIGTPTSKERKPFFPGARLGLNENANGQAALNAGLAALAKPVGPGVEIYIQNNVPYIETLNSGSSAQAPAQFVQIALMNGLQVVKQSLILNERF